MRTLLAYLQTAAVLVALQFILLPLGFFAFLLSLLRFS